MFVLALASPYFTFRLIPPPHLFVAMGGSTWATPEEWAFLVLNVPQYEAAQASKKTSFWIPQYLIRFFEKFQDYSNGKNTTPRATVEKVSLTPR